MAVSFDEAWNSFIVEEPHVNRKPEIHVQRHVEKKEEKPISAKSSRDTSLEKLTTLEVSMKDMNASNKVHIELLERMVDELSELRKEEAKRSTIYIIMGAILFACLFMYIEKLQCKIKSLTSHMHHQLSHRSEHIMKPVTSEPFPWFA